MDILKEALKHYGTHKQMKKVVEECAELIQAVMKADDAGIIKDWGIARASVESSQKDTEAYNNLVSEIADVRIILKYFDLLVAKSDIERVEKEKLERLKLRITNEKTKQVSL
jgi:NTP pyrophosphatase (non-canonical NTP hydrolase)